MGSAAHTVALVLSIRPAKRRFTPPTLKNKVGRTRVCYFGNGNKLFSENKLCGDNILPSQERLVGSAT